MSTESAQPFRHYETIYVLAPNSPTAASKKVSGRVEEIVAKEGGKLTRVENWGHRKLAYPVRKFTRGVYVYVQYQGRGRIVTELERNLRILEGVLKFQTIKLDTPKEAEAATDEDVAFEHFDPVEEEETIAAKARALGLEPRKPRNEDGEAKAADGAKDGEAEAADSAKDGEAEAADSAKDGEAGAADGAKDGEAKAADKAPAKTEEAKPAADAAEKTEDTS